MSIKYDVNCILSTPFLFQRPNYKKARPIVLPISVLFQSSTNNFRIVRNSIIQWSLVCCSYFLWLCQFKLRRVKIWFPKIMPMVAQSFSLRYKRNISVYWELEQMETEFSGARRRLRSAHFTKHQVLNFGAQ